MPEIQKARVAFVDDEPDLAETLRILFGADYDITFFISPEEALKQIDSSFAVVVSDQRMPTMTGDELLAQVRLKTPDTVRILLTAVQDQELLEIFPKLINDGHIFRFLPKDLETIEHRLKEALIEAVDVHAGREERKRKERDLIRETKQLRAQLRLKTRFEDLLGHDPQLMEAIDQGRDAAKNVERVLIVGESGTGKEIMACAIHFEGPRRAKPFVALNCSYYTEPDRFRSELMGHTKDAYPGAGQASLGLLRGVDGGTIFLDEIGELRLDMQATLLRFLESGDIQPLGSTVPSNLKVDVRTIAATNRNLEEEIKKGKFREDLFFRLTKHEIIRLPPLRERRGDIEELIRHELISIAAGEGLREIPIDQAALDILRQLPYKGNVRELNSILSRAVRRMLRLRGSVLNTETLDKGIHLQASTSNTWIDSRKEFQKKQVEDALKRHETYEAAAAELGISVRQLHNLRKEFNLLPQKK